MAVGLQSRTRKTTKKVSPRKPADTARELAPETTSFAPHVAGTLAQREPDENAYRPHEEPEAAARNSEAPDAGDARCTEFSDFSHRGRDWS